MNNSEEIPQASLEEITIAAQFQPPPAAPDFDIGAIALPQNFAELAAVKTETVAIPIHKPNKQAWFAVHPEQRHWKCFLILQDEADHSKNFILSPVLKDALDGECAAKILVPCVTALGTFFFWPIRLPDAAGKVDSWNASALAIATAKGNQWLRLTSNQESGSYVASQPVGLRPPPDWPADIDALYRKAVNAVLISDLSHPLLKRLRGETL